MIEIDVDVRDVITLANAKFGVAAITRVAIAVAAALTVEAEKIMTDSKRSYVPVDTGTLKSSGHVKPVQMMGNNASVELGYGGPAAPYALIVHERPPSIGQGKNKYLTTPFNQALTGMSDRIMARVIQKVLS